MKHAIYDGHVNKCQYLYFCARRASKLSPHIVQDGGELEAEAVVEQGAGAEEEVERVEDGLGRQEHVEHA